MRTRKQEIARLIDQIDRAKVEIEQIEVNTLLTEQSKRVRVRVLLEHIANCRSDLFSLSLKEKKT